MLDVLYVLACAVAFAGVRKGNWTAVPLLASAAFCALARWQAWPFNAWLWLAVDVLTMIGVAAPIASPVWGIVRAGAWRGLLAFRIELVVLALFVPAFAGYAMPVGPAYVLTSLAATAQLMVTPPYRRFLARFRRSLRRHDEWTHFDLKVAAA